MDPGNPVISGLSGCGRSFYGCFSDLPNVIILIESCGFQELDALLVSYCHQDECGSHPVVPVLVPERKTE
jgi:hypothetical protein